MLLFRVKLTGREKMTKIQVKYKKRLLHRCIHHSKSELINNMDHMRNHSGVTKHVDLPKYIPVLHALRVDDVLSDLTSYNT